MYTLTVVLGKLKLKLVCSSFRHIFKELPLPPPGSNLKREQPLDLAICSEETDFQ